MPSFADEIVRAIIEERSRSLGRVHPNVADVLDHVHEHITDSSLEVRAVLRARGITTHTFSERFKSDMLACGLGSITLKRYIDGLRIDIAEAFIRKTTLPLRRISELSGFVNYATFFRAWKRIRSDMPSGLERGGDGALP